MPQQQQDLFKFYLVNWSFDEPVHLTGVSIGKSPEEAQSKIARSFDGAPNLKFDSTEEVSKEKIIEMGTSEEKLQELILEAQNERLN